MKYLILKFSNAGWFDSSLKTKDYVFDINGQYSRKECQKYKEPITFYQICNMLHVLMGERPKPSLRFSYIETNPHILELAKNSYLQIDDFKYEYNNKSYIIKEKIRIKKSVWNSYDPSLNLIYWKRFQKYLNNDELFNECINIFQNVLNIENIFTISAYDCFKKLNNVKYVNNTLLINLKNKLKENKKTPIFRLIEDIKHKDSILKNEQRITVNNDITDVIRLSGKIVIPIDDLGIEKIKNSKGCATLLDGGFIEIIGIRNFFSDENYLKISEISTETVNITNK